METSRKWILAAACSLIGHSTCVAGESLDRLGRLWGYGYSDGYHACGRDCYHVGENLPPLSFTAQPSYHAAAHRLPTVHAHSGVACDQNWSPAQSPGWQDSGSPKPYSQAPGSSAPDGGTVIQDRLLHETNPSTQSAPGLLAPGQAPRNIVPEAIPLSPYSPSESADVKPTPAKQPAPANTPKRPAVPKLMPQDIKGEPEELPAPHREPLSPSDDEARSKYRRMNPASFSTPVARPSRLGASTPGWTPPGTK